MEQGKDVVRMLPIQRVPIESHGIDLRPFAEAFAFYASGQGTLEQVRQEIHRLTTEGNR